jgi:hypothetical protein
MRMTAAATGLVHKFPRKSINVMVHAGIAASTGLQVAGVTNFQVRGSIAKHASFGHYITLRTQAH